MSLSLPKSDHNLIHWSAASGFDELKMPTVCSTELNSTEYTRKVCGRESGSIMISRQVLHPLEQGLLHCQAVSNSCYMNPVCNKAYHGPQSSPRAASAQGPQKAHDRQHVAIDVQAALAQEPLKVCLRFCVHLQVHLCLLLAEAHCKASSLWRLTTPETATSNMPADIVPALLSWS